MKLIFAQGNPGKQHEKTRHNIGFTILDSFAERHDLEFQSKMKFNADVAEYTHAGEKILLVKPMTFYNDTGVSARAIADFYKIAISDVLVLHDELMLPFSKIRVRHSGRDAGNNGIKSLNAHIGDTFARLRIGIQNDQHPHTQDTDFVLGKFTAHEQKIIQDSLYQETELLIEKFLNNSLKDESISLSM